MQVTHLDVVQQLNSVVPRILENYGKDCLTFPTFEEWLFPLPDGLQNKLKNYCLDVAEQLANLFKDL